MRFLVDESTGPNVAGWLRREGHEVFSVYESARGMVDEEIMRKAFAQDWILITNDKGFGERVYGQRRPHQGVVLLRLDDERAANKIETLRRLLDRYSTRGQLCRGHGETSSFRPRMMFRPAGRGWPPGSFSRAVAKADYRGVRNLMTLHSAN